MTLTMSSYVTVLCSLEVVAPDAWACTTPDIMLVGCCCSMGVVFVKMCVAQEVLGTKRRTTREKDKFPVGGDQKKKKKTLRLLCVVFCVVLSSLASWRRGQVNIWCLNTRHLSGAD